MIACQKIVLLIRFTTLSQLLVTYSVSESLKENQHIGGELFWTVRNASTFSNVS